MKKIFAITGATGNIGGRVVEALLKEGHEVRVLGRDSKKLASLTAKGAKAFVGQPEDVEVLVKAFRGADAVYAMVPPHYGADDYRGYQNVVGDAIYRALAETGVKKVVNLSSIGAQHAEGVGVVKGLHDQEQRLNRLEHADIVHLRPAFFLENSLFSVGLIKSAGINGSPLRPEVKIPMIATRDIAERAIQHLRSLDFVGRRVEELHGQRDLAFPELTSVLGKAIGKPELRYECFPYEGARAAMVQSGLSESFAREMVELYRALNDGLSRPTQARDAMTTTATSVESFSETFAHAFRSAQ